jgi:hypothetical protein
MTVLPVLALFLAVILIRRYSITQRTASVTRQLLEDRRGAL